MSEERDSVVIAFIVVGVMLLFAVGVGGFWAFRARSATQRAINLAQQAQVEEMRRMETILQATAEQQRSDAQN